MSRYFLCIILIILTIFQKVGQNFSLLNTGCHAKAVVKYIFFKSASQKSIGNIMCDDVFNNFNGFKRPLIVCKRILFLQTFLIHVVSRNPLMKDKCCCTCVL